MAFCLRIEHIIYRENKENILKPENKTLHYMIPKLIHFIWWQGENELPPKYRENVNNWRDNNPSFQVKVWNEYELTKLCAEHYPQYLQNFSESQHIMEQIDLSKFMLLEVYGGFYVDTDIEFVKPIPSHWLNYRAIFSELFTNDACVGDFCFSVYIFSLGHSDKVIYNSGFYAGMPNAGIFRDILREAMKLRRSMSRLLGKQIYVTYTAGPPFITIYISKHLKNRKDILLLTPTHIEACGVNYQFSKNVKDCDMSEDTVGIHKHGLSWASPIHFFVLKCIYHRVKITEIIFFVLFVILVILGLYWILKHSM